jgi:hypothetical protein
MYSFVDPRSPSTPPPPQPQPQVSALVGLAIIFYGILDNLKN